MTDRKYWNGKDEHCVETTVVQRAYEWFKG